MRRAQIALLTAMLGASAPALGQDATFAVRSLTPEIALKAAQAALQTCRAAGFQVAVAIVDRMGISQIVLRDRFAGPHTVDVASNKAWTALTLRQDTLGLARLSASGDMAGLRHFDRVVAVGGGVPIDGGGALLGGIGVSGAPGGAADDVCAKSGLAAIEEDINF